MAIFVIAIPGVAMGPWPVPKGEGGDYNFVYNTSYIAHNRYTNLTFSGHEELCALIYLMPVLIK